MHKRRWIKYGDLEALDKSQVGAMEKVYECIKHYQTLKRKRPINMYQIRKKTKMHHTTVKLAVIYLSRT